VIATPAYFMTAGPFPEYPRRGTPQLLREGSKPDGRDALRLGAREPGPRPADALNAEGWKMPIARASIPCRDLAKESHVLCASKRASPAREHY